MTIGANSYGDTGIIAALTPRWAGAGGVFGVSTQPTLTQVEHFVDQVSAALNSILSKNGFTIPVTQTDCVLMLAAFVEQEVAAIVEGIHGSGRFGPTSKTVTKSRWAVIMEDVEAFIEANTVGLVRMGAARPYSIAAEIAYRDTDNSGATVPPLFERKAFNRPQEEWDTR